MSNHARSLSPLADGCSLTYTNIRPPLLQVGRRGWRVRVDSLWVICLSRLVFALTTASADSDCLFLLSSLLLSLGLNATKSGYLFVSHPHLSCWHTLPPLYLFDTHPALLRTHSCWSYRPPPLPTPICSSSLAVPQDRHAHLLPPLRHLLDQFAAEDGSSSVEGVARPPWRPSFLVGLADLLRLPDLLPTTSLLSPPPTPLPLLLPSPLKGPP